MTKKTLLSRCNIKKKDVFVIHNGVNLPDINRFSSNKSNEILTVANLSPRKGYIEYLDIISQVVKLVPDLKFIFLGRDDMNGLVQRKIIEYELSDFVSYEGFHSDLKEFYKRAKLFVLPSLWGEGCPTSILEALSYSLPVVAYNIDGIPELINNGNDGVLLELGDTNVSYEIADLLKSPDKLSLMGQRGREKIKHKFRIESSVRAHNVVLNKVLMN